MVCEAFQEEIGSRMGRRLKGETRGCLKRADHPFEIALCPLLGVCGYFVEWDCGADLSADTIEARWQVVGKVARQTTA